MKLADSLGVHITSSDFSGILEIFLLNLHFACFTGVYLKVRLSIKPNHNSFITALSYVQRNSFVKSPSVGKTNARNYSNESTNFINNIFLLKEII